MDSKLKTFSIQGNDVSITGIYQISQNHFSGESEDFPKYCNTNPNKIKLDGELTPSGGTLLILIAGENWGKIKINYAGPPLDKPTSL